MRLGWRPPQQRGEYDILPLVLQAQGGEAQMFDIPRELIIEVELQHPQLVRCCLATTHFLVTFISKYLFVLEHQTSLVCSKPSGVRLHW